MASYLMLGPLLILLVILFGLPIVSELVSSLTSPTVGIGNYAALLRHRADVAAFLTTLRIAAVVSLVTLPIGYLLAGTLTRLSGGVAVVVLALMLVPFWISAIVRNFAWILLLQKNGPVNALLLATGLIHQPLQILYTSTAVYIGMVSVLLPYMVLPIYSVMRGINIDLLKAARSLGAPPARAFVEIFLPMSLPGVVAGSILVFILALGYFITPSLLGNPQDTMVAVLIYQQTEAFNWPEAFALSTMLLAITLGLYAVASASVGIGRMLVGSTEL